MSKANEKKWRAAFRKAVLERDGYKCKVCGEAGTDETLDPHHITNRNDLDHGGYVAENGITLCKKVGGCHEKAEASLKYQNNLLHDGPLVGDLVVHRNYSPRVLYALIGSSYEKAVEAAKKLEST